MRDIHFGGVAPSPIEAKAKFDMNEPQAKGYFTQRNLASGGTWNGEGIKVKDVGKFHFNPFKKLDIGGFMTKYPWVSPITSGVHNLATESKVKPTPVEPSVQKALETAQLETPGIDVRTGKPAMSGGEPGGPLGGGSSTAGTGGGAAGIKRFTLDTPEQAYSRKLALGNFNKYAGNLNSNIGKTVREFQTQTMPSLFERFEKMGTGNQRSGALEPHIAAAGAHLRENLEAMKQQNSMQMGNLGMGHNAFENVQVNKAPGLGEQVIPEAIKAAVPYLLNLMK